jgi:hypothetical protein
MDDAQNDLEQGTFDLDEYVNGRGFPRDTVTVFTNADAAYERAQLQARLTEIAQDKEKLGEATRSRKYKDLQAEMEPLEARSEELMEDIKASALTFHLRGIAPGHVKKIISDVNIEAEKEQWDSNYSASVATYRIMAPHIIKVVRADGKEDNRKFTEERAQLMDEMLPDSEWTKLDQKVQALSFKSAYFDAAVDAGFLQKS